MTVQNAPSGATNSLAPIYPVVELKTLKRIQRLADAALDLIASVEDDATADVAADGRLLAPEDISAHVAQLGEDLRQAAALKRLGATAAARAGLEELMSLIDEAIDQDEPASVEVMCMGWPIRLMGTGSVSLKVAARAVEVNELNLGWKRLFGETA